MKKNVLVTGGGGFLGNAIVKQLLEKKNNITSFSRNYYENLEKTCVKQIQGDLKNIEDVQNAVKGNDIVFHVAAKPGIWGKYSEYYDTNVKGTENIIAACKKFNISQLIYTSSPSVIFDGKDMEGIDETVPYPDTYHAHYPKTKAMAEKLVIKASNILPTIILRPHLIWGPEDNHLIPRIIKKADKLVKIGKEDKLVDTLYIDNAAYAHILAQKKLEQNPSLSGNVYFITQDEPIPLWDMVNSILKAADCKPIEKYLPYKVVYTIGSLLEFIYKSLNLKNEPPMTKFVVQELATAHWFDISAAKNDLGYTPKISTKKGLEYLEKWFNEQK